MRINFHIPKALPTTHGKYIDCHYVIDVLTEVAIDEGGPTFSHLPAPFIRGPPYEIDRGAG